eukprot:Sspe_Gene.87306::Locus_58441_Transcript_1_2_Confidence_0.667_Length_653::g.87306::m.87306/K00567/ogt, MGMT; methylated-DNA-[protein]-cysteine S-methyltransferase
MKVVARNIAFDALVQKRSAKLTKFRHRVLRLVFDIPQGNVTTYKELAKAVGCGSCQAIGQALRGNPLAPDVPCHRVVSASRKLGGFCGASGGKLVQKKMDMLVAEGVRFEETGLVSESHLMRFA